MSKKIKSYIMWGRIMSLLSLFIFVIAPLIVGAIYLPSLIKGGLGSIINPASILNPGQSNNAILQQLLNGTNLNQEDLLKSVQDQGGAVNSYQNILDFYKSR